MSGRTRRAVSTVTVTSAPAVTSASAVIAKAIDLIEAGGLEALSMRRLGDAFGIKAASIYWYVSSRDSLLDLVVDELNRRAAEHISTRNRCCPTPAAQLIHLGYLYRAFLYAHPHSEQLLASRLPAGGNRIALTTAFVEDLITRHAVPAETAVAAAAAVRTFIHGYVIDHHARRAVIDEHGQGIEASHAQFQTAMASADHTSGRPCLAPAARELLAHQLDFSLSLQAIVIGMLGSCEQAHSIEQAAS